MVLPLLSFPHAESDKATLYPLIGFSLAWYFDLEVNQKIVTGKLSTSRTNPNNVGALLSYTDDFLIFAITTLSNCW